MAGPTLVKTPKNVIITADEEAEARDFLGGRYSKYDVNRQNGMTHADALAKARKPD